MKRKIALALCFAGLLIQWGRVTTAQTGQGPRETFAVTNPLHKSALAQVEKDLALAQARYDNVVLKLRLALGVPNDYEWDGTSQSFLPPKPAPSPSPSPKALIKFFCL